MTCTILAVARASVTEISGGSARAGVLLERAQRVPFYRRTNRMCKFDPYVTFSHYLPQPCIFLEKNLVSGTFVRLANALERIFHDYPKATPDEPEKNKKKHVIKEHSKNVFFAKVC